VAGGGGATVPTSDNMLHNLVKRKTAQKTRAKTG
jgi:hypothetical protein